MNTLAWTIYWIGVVLAPVVIGMSLPNKGSFKVFEDGIPMFFLSLMWPAVLALGILVLVCTGLVALPGFLWVFLMMIGGSVGRKLETPPKKEEVLESDGKGK